MSITSVQSNLMTVLSGIAGITAYDHEPENLLTMPATTLQYGEVKQQRTRFGTRTATYTFLLRLYVGMEIEEAAAYSLVKTLSDSILSTFNTKTNANLNGAVLTQDITSGVLEAQTDLQRPRYLHTFSITVQEEV